MERAPMSRPHAVFAVATALSLLGFACSRPAPAPPAADDLLRHITVLASDEYEGRAPGTRGEDLTVAYLRRRRQALGR